MSELRPVPASTKISIVTPSFNQAEYLEQTLDSVLSQNYPELEYIVIDGGSTDGSVDIIKKYAKHSTHWVSEPDRGQSHAINKGLSRSTGQLFNWINSDDYLELGALKKINDLFRSSNCDILLAKTRIVENGDSRIGNWSPFYPNEPSKSIGSAKVNQPGMWWKKSVLNQIGQINEELNYVMDLDLWIKYFLRKKEFNIETTNEITANFRLHPNSKTVGARSDFDKERNGYYYALASFYKLENEIRNLEPLDMNRSVKLTGLPEKTNLHTLTRAFSFFYLLLGDEAYVEGDHHRLRKWLEIIDVSVLQPQDRKLYRKLRNRSIFPAGLAKIARLIKGRQDT